MSWWIPLATGLATGAGILVFMLSLHFLFPELLIYRRIKHRRQLLDVARRNAKITSTSMFATMMAILLPYFILSFSTSWAVNEWAYPIFMTLSVLSPYLVFQKRIQIQMRKELCNRGHPVCLGCGYNLRSNLSGRCPECGSKTKPEES